MKLGYMGKWPQRERMGDFKYPEIKANPKCPWLIMFGEAGTGKTAWALDWLLKHGEGWEFFSTIEFMDWLRGAARNELSVNNIIGTAAEYPLMVIDDLGNEPVDKFSNFGTVYTPREIMIDVLFRRHQAKLKTVISTNMTTQKLKDTYGDFIYSRMKELSTWVRFTGDYRQGKTVKVEVVK
jgi:DNA replication protein DnaC